MARFVSPITDIKPLGTVSFFDSNTNAPKITFKDELESDALKNLPEIPVDADGNLPNIFFSGSASVIYKDEFNQQYAARNPVGEEVGLGNFSIWNPNVVYGEGDFVKGSDGSFYESDSNGNQGNDPTSTTGFWDKIILPNPWINKTTNFTVEANQQYQIDGSAGAVDGALAASYAIGDQLIIHNESISTNTVRLTNTSLTIKGPGGTATSADNITIAAGKTAILVAKTTTILESI